MDSVDKSLGINLTEDEFSEKKTIYINKIIENSESILNCLTKVVNQKDKINNENLFRYRLEALIRVITLNVNKLKRLKNNKNANERICDLEIQLDKYSRDANSLITEIMETGKVPKQYCH